MGICNNCHRPKNTDTHAKIWRNWICDMAVLKDGRVVHVSRLPTLFAEENVKVKNYWIERGTR